MCNLREEIHRGQCFPGLSLLQFKLCGGIQEQEKGWIRSGPGLEEGRQPLGLPLPCGYRLQDTQLQNLRVEPGSGEEEEKWQLKNG